MLRSCSEPFSFRNLCDWLGAVMFAWIRRLFCSHRWIYSRPLAGSVQASLKPGRERPLLTALRTSGTTAGRTTAPRQERTSAVLRKLDVQLNLD